MEGHLKKLLLLGTYLIIVDVTHQTSSTSYIHEYILITHLKMSWTEAQSYCRAEYSDLATIFNEEALNVVSNMAKDTERPFWIGLYDDVNSWKWSLLGERFYAGVEEDYRKWQEGQPDNEGGDEHCVSMMADGFWRDSSCTFVKMPLICFADGGTDQYVLVTQEKSWLEAQSYCRRHHTDLVSARSPAENQEVWRRLQGNQTVQEAWIGLHRDSWKWSDGSRSTFRHWWEWEPDNENNSQACASMHEGRWNDWNCDTKFNLLCQNITEVTELITSHQAVQRWITVKMKLQTESDLKDPNVRHEVLQQFQAAFHFQGFTEVKLLWRTLKQEPRPAERDACEEEINGILN